MNQLNTASTIKIFGGSKTNNTESENSVKVKYTPINIPKIESGYNPRTPINGCLLNLNCD